MTLEQRVADFERRMAAVEHVTTPLIPLGPRVAAVEELDRRREAWVQELIEVIDHDRG